MPLGHPTDCFYCCHRGKRGVVENRARCDVTGEEVHFNNAGPLIECADFHRLPDRALMIRIHEDNNRALSGQPPLATAG